MANIGKGMLAGLAATAVLSVLIVVKAIVGVMPALDLPPMIAGMMGTPDTPTLGCAIHVIYRRGGLRHCRQAVRAAFRQPDRQRHRNRAVGWLIMMLVLMSMAGVGCSRYRWA